MTRRFLHTDTLPRHARRNRPTLDPSLGDPGGSATSPACHRSSGPNRDTRQADRRPVIVCVEVGRRMLLAELKFSGWVLRRVTRVRFDSARAAGAQP